ncbi:MAG TPA: peptidylprolyl isomerase, partial [Anaerolineaceae bacterium]|nr:peptidylprolyl isomerase [Anaerolineaceae bacterium]
NELLYSRQPDWINLPADAFMDWVMKESPGYHIDAEQLKVNMENPAVMTRVKQVIEDATPLAISTTPVLFMNSLRVKTRLNAESMAELVEYFLLQKTAFTECPANTIDPQKTYLATFHTEKGNIVFELFPQVAPMAVNSFVFLARKGWYDNSTFFRVIPGYVVQGGDPSGSGLGGPGYVFSNEVDPQLRFNTPGLLGLTHTSGGMNGSQFFITYTALPELDGQFTIIGRVIEGVNVLNALRPRNPESDVILLPADRLLQVTIEEIE